MKPANDRFARSRTANPYALSHAELRQWKLWPCFFATANAVSTTAAAPTNATAAITTAATQQPGPPTTPNAWFGGKSGKAVGPQHGGKAEGGKGQYHGGKAQSGKGGGKQEGNKAVKTAASREGKKVKKVMAGFKCFKGQCKHTAWKMPWPVCIGLCSATLIMRFIQNPEPRKTSERYMSILVKMGNACTKN